MKTTFWGLNVIKRPEKVSVAKRGMEKMFDIMLPNHAGQLPILKMNMGGMGSKMIQAVMKQKNVDPLPVMIAQAQKMGVKMVACTMSMDIMGIKEEEIIEGVDFGGSLFFWHSVGFAGNKRSCRLIVKRMIPNSRRKTRVLTERKTKNAEQPTNHQGVG